MLSNSPTEFQTLDVTMQIAKVTYEVTYESRLEKQQAINSVLFLLLSKSTAAANPLLKTSPHSWIH